MNETPLPESLENFLQAPPSLRPEADMQDLLLKQTSTFLHKPRSRLRWVVCLGVAASIILTMVTAYFAIRSGFVAPRPRKDLADRVVTPPPPKDEPKPQPAPDEPTPPAAAASVNPLDLEWTAFDEHNDQKRASLYFQAGDLYLEKQDDYESALRCYRQALTYCEAHELEFNPNDNWLVMALKRDHRKEK
jgi:hypothetical protein